MLVEKRDNPRGQTDTSRFKEKSPLFALFIFFFFQRIFLLYIKFLYSFIYFVFLPERISDF